MSGPQQRRVVRITPEGKSAIGLDGKHTPFTWNVEVLNPIRTNVEEDQLCLQGTPWTMLLGRLRIAFCYYNNREFRKGCSLLAECLMPLLPYACFDTGCEIIRHHKEALRHVLDSTWVAMGQMDKMVEGRFLPDASWRAFADTITPYDKLDSAQQAAIVAMRGFLLYDAELLREAIALNPKEGEWHRLLGFVLAEQRGEGQYNPSPATREELASLRRGLKLRVSPDAMTQLVRGLLDARPADIPKALKVMEEAMEKFPNNVHVLWSYSHLWPRLFIGRAVPAGRSRQELLSRCLSLLGGRCAYALQIMSIETKVLAQFKQKGSTMAEAERYSAQALAVNRGAAIAAMHEARMLL